MAIRPIYSLTDCVKATATNAISKRAQVVMLTLGLGFSLPLYADTAAVSAQVGVGTEYDSNVSLVELDRNTQQGDWATKTNLGLTAEWQPKEKLTLRGGVFYDGKKYQQYESFDLAVARGNLESSYRFSWLTAGASYNYAAAYLDRQDFLALSQTSVFASKLFTQKFYLRAAATQKHKTFAEQSQRNADTWEWSGDFYRFMNSGQRFITVGFSLEQESARDQAYSFDGVNLRARWSNDFKLWNKSSQVQLGWRYLKRNYSAANVSVGSDPQGESQQSGVEQLDGLQDEYGDANSDGQAARIANRADTQQHIELQWSVKLNRYISVATKLSASDYQSNLAAADYRETLSSLQIKAEF
ncbi:hypothetical protein [Teredinibacter waterburyi]|uniref:hypothetical protein n=1 Tax=Teredinibacter waterburyi TaxID=1500538 RepID=UPI00165FAA32|nr:hypothetical protein [Teredinibacter waterburyi]